MVFSRHSSVVEHVIGNDGAASSILAGGTIRLFIKRDLRLFQRFFISFMPRLSETYLAGIFCVILATFGFASQGIVVKFLFLQHTSIMSILLLRKMLFLPLYWLFSRKLFLSEKNNISARHKTISFAAGIFGYYLAPFSSLHALQLIGAGIERIILYCFPALVILLQSLLNRKMPSIPYLIVFLIIQGGIYFVIGGTNREAISTNDLHGALWSLSGALCFSIYVVCNQKMVRYMSTTTFILYALCGAFVAVLCHFFLSEPFSSLQLSAQAWAYIAAFALLCTFVPVFMFSIAVKRIGSEKASIISMLSPFLTVIFAYLFLGETLTSHQILGGAAIILSILLLETRGFGFLRKKNRLMLYRA